MTSFLPVWRTQSYTLQQSFLQWTGCKISHIIQSSHKKTDSVIQDLILCKTECSWTEVHWRLRGSGDKPIGLGTSKLASEEMITASNLESSNQDQGKRTNWPKSPSTPTPALQRLGVLLIRAAAAGWSYYLTTILMGYTPTLSLFCLGML